MVPAGRHRQSAICLSSTGDRAHVPPCFPFGPIGEHISGSSLDAKKELRRGREHGIVHKRCFSSIHLNRVGCTINSNLLKPKTSLRACQRHRQPTRRNISNPLRKATAEFASLKLMARRQNQIERSRWEVWEWIVQPVVQSITILTECWWMDSSTGITTKEWQTNQAQTQDKVQRSAETTVG